MTSTCGTATIQSRSFRTRVSRARSSSSALGKSWAIGSVSPYVYELGRELLRAPEARHLRHLHHVSEAHLRLYLQEFDFRYNHRIALCCDDATRPARAAKGIPGQRLT